MPAPDLHPIPLSGERLGSIDALRGAAALYVVLYHLALMPQPNLAVPGWASRVVLTGGAGVTLFFLVSSFCLCLSMQRHKQEPNRVMGFYLRRIFRIVPLFYLWLVLSLVRDKLMFGVNHSWTDVFLSASFSFNFVPGKHEGFVWAGWTVGVEMVFYLLFPLIYRWVNNWWKSLAFFPVSLLVAALYGKIINYLPVTVAHRDSFVQFSVLSQLPIFTIGMITFFIYDRFIRKKLIHPGLAYAVTGTAVAWYGAVIGIVPSFNDFLLGRRLGFLLRWDWVGFIYSGLLLGLSIAPLRLFVNRIMLFYGKISYSVYLCHPTIVFLLIPIYRKIYGSNLPVTVQYGTCLLLVLAPVTMLSYCTYRFIERPGMRLGSRIIKRLAAEKPDPAAGPA